MPTASPALVPRVLRLLALLLGGVATVAMSQPVEVFSPQGSVKGVRQASACSRRRWYPSATRASSIRS